jgi:hypothetical protein
MAIWLSGDRAMSIDIMKNEHNHNTTEVIRAFLEKKCSEKFTSDSHLFASFKKYWPTYKPEKSQGKISTAHDEYFS